MRLRALPTAAVAASLTLLAGLTATSADARTTRELKVCWQAPTGNTLPLTIEVSGRQHGERALANGTCKAWDVPSGSYTLTAKASAIRTIFNASPQGRDTVCGKSSFHNFRVVAAVTQRGTTRTVRLGESGGSFGVQVRAGHLTKANFRLECSS
jgi:hypothetical protein